MAMDALRNITGNVPSWLTRLDELSGQIDKRQAELAAVAALDAPDKLSETRSLRNKGSQESLKPADDGPSHIPASEDEGLESAMPPPTTLPNTSAPEPSETNAPVKTAPASPGAQSGSQKHPRDAAAAAIRTRAQVKKRTRSTSVISAEEVQTAYRTRNMIIVYYDSYVQGFFDELVRYISMSRNLGRKAKVAARMAQIKKLAEVDSSNPGEDGEDSLPSLRYTPSRRFGPLGALRSGLGGVAGQNEEPDIYDILDKGLEAVQSTCEHGAHQFLRDADCNEEIKKIQNKLREVLATAEKETERVIREEPEVAQETSDLNKTRTHRPISMRKDYVYPPKEAGKVDKPIAVDTIAVDTDSQPNPTKSSEPAEPASTAIEPDAIAIDVDDSGPIEIEIPRMQYRSTRNMRYRPGAQG